MAAFLLKSVMLLTCKWLPFFWRVMLLTCKWLPFFWRVSCSLHVNGCLSFEECRAPYILMAAFLLKSVVLTCKWLPFFWRVSCSLHVNTTAPNQQLFVRWSFVVNFFSTISFILFPCDNQNIYMHAFHNSLPQSFTYISYCLSKEEFEDTKGVIRIQISKNKHNGQKKKQRST